MDDNKPYSVPLMRVSPMFYKEKTFWEKRLTSDEQFRDIASVDQIELNPKNLDEMLVTSLARLSMYDSNNLEVERTYKTSTQYQVYGGCFRKSDGRLIAVGSEEGKVFVFEVHNTNPLRVFNLKVPTHRVLFMENKLVSFSDDLALRILDVGSGEVVRTYGGTGSRTEANSPFHIDYIRSGTLIDQLIVSGSYDGSVKLWDPRVDDPKPVISFTHGPAVESCCTRGDTLLISVGGNKLHVFDMIARKTLTSMIPKHHKTITSVSNYDDKYLLTGGLDGYLNVIDFNYEYVTRFNYDEAQILSTAVNLKLLAIGFNDHRVQVKRFKDFIKKSDNEAAELEKLQSGYFGPNMVTRYFHEAIADCQDPIANQRAMLALKQRKVPVTLGDSETLYQRVVIPKLKKSDFAQRSKCERLLAAFNHHKALNHALNNQRRGPEMVITVLKELMRRGRLQGALTDLSIINRFMIFLSLNLNDIRHDRLLLDCAIMLIDTVISNKHLIRHKYERKFWFNLENLVRTVDRELKVIDSCTTIAAQLNTVISQY